MSQSPERCRTFRSVRHMTHQCVMLLGRWWCQTAIGHSAVTGWSSARHDFSWWVWHEQIGRWGCGNTTTTAQYLLIPLTLHGLGGPVSSWVAAFQQWFQSLLRAATTFITLISSIGFKVSPLHRLLFVLCDNPGNSCGKSPIATVIVVTPLLEVCSGQRQWEVSNYLILSLVFWSSSPLLPLLYIAALLIKTRCFYRTLQCPLFLLFAYLTSCCSSLHISRTAFNSYLWVLQNCY